jgi:hypothetical protein
MNLLDQTNLGIANAFDPLGSDENTAATWKPRVSKLFKFTTLRKEGSIGPTIIGKEFKFLNGIGFLTSI